MAKSTKPQKPSKPHPDFPLFAHATGRWAKKVRQKFHYFGKWDDPQAALEKWLEQKDELLAGRTPREPDEGLTVSDLCNRFLTAKNRRLDTGEITLRTWHDYTAVCRRITKWFTRERLVAGLTADDFEEFRAELANGRGPVSLGNEIGKVRIVFKYGYDSGLIDRPVRYGPGFDKPSRKTLRKARHERGKRMFEPNELNTILDVLAGDAITLPSIADKGRRVAIKPNPVLKAMVLLGINCGFGQTDLANLPKSALNLDSGWCEFPRPKTGVERRCPLWPETVEAVRVALQLRSKPKDPTDDDLCFITRYGNRWGRTTAKGAACDPVAQKFRKVLNALEITGHRCFYALRHTFRTVADRSKDQPAIDHIMGHSRPDMASLYREGIDDDRLEDVVAVVHAWLWPDAANA